jgi:hypothetical protein
LKSPLSIELKLGYKKLSNDPQIKYSGTTVFAAATVHLLSLGGCNDPIAIVVGHAEHCHLPWWVNFELKMRLQIKK